MSHILISGIKNTCPGSALLKAGSSDKEFVHGAGLQASGGQLPLRQTVSIVGL